ncbi:hypothetical protein [Flavobacterium sp. J27]|uniref:hypothetical protein n=1 Tax=Flavobacterium sp. J27 TaxID=2060419 RepID=UPI0010309887|nr:hypothetical protein [Flavobacterium sp. J27]
MKNNLLKSIILVLTILTWSCSKDDDYQTILLPTQVEIIYPSAAASYQTLDITYNDQFSIKTVTRNRSGNHKIIYTCSYNSERLLTKLKIVEQPSNIEREYQMQYTNSLLSKITELHSGTTTEYNIDYNSTTNTYKYNFPYTWKFNDAHDLEYYYFSSTTAFDITYSNGNAFNQFMKPQPALAILDSYFAENFFQDLFFLNKKPISMTRYEDLVSSDVIEHHYTNTFNANNKLIKSEIRVNTDVNPTIIKYITYQEKRY